MDKFVSLQFSDDEEDEVKKPIHVMQGKKHGSHHSISQIFLDKISAEEDTPRARRENRAKKFNITPLMEFDPKDLALDTQAPSILDSVEDKPLEKLTARPNEKKKKKKEEKTDSSWINFKEATPELKRDVQSLYLREFIDRKRGYKKWGKEDQPTTFQMGRVLDNPTDFYSSRLTKKERKQTFLGELLADENLQEYIGKKADEIEHKYGNKRKKNMGKKNIAFKRRRV